MTTDRPIVLASNRVNLLSGGTAVADVARTRALINAPLLIDRINFALQAPPQASAQSGRLQADIAASIGCRIQVGRHYMSTEFVPVWNYCQTLAAVAGQGYVTSGNEWDTPSSDSTPCSQYSWKLPKPLFVPKDAVLVPYFSRLEDGLGTTATAQVSFGGAVLAGSSDEPDFMDVPWVSHWRGTLATAGTRSLENDLKNWLDKPVHVQRLIGRVLNDDLAGSNTYKEELREISTSINVRISDWSSYYLVDDFVRWASVFDFNRRSWNIGYDVPAGKSLYVQTGPYTSTYFAGSRVGYVSMVGYRREAR